MNYPIFPTDGLNTSTCCCSPTTINRRTTLAIHHAFGVGLPVPYIRENALNMSANLGALRY